MFEKLMREHGNRRVAALVLALATAHPGSALAQNVADAPASARAPLTKANFDEHNVDESALRYYASTGQTERMATELRRLRSLYTNWTPPENIYERLGDGVDEEDLWDLLTAGKLEQLRAAIDERRAAEPGWEPSLDLRAKYRVKAFRTQVEALARDERWSDIARLTPTGTPLDGIDVDILWTIAEAYQHSLQTANALNVYKTILTNNSDSKQRVATLQKSMGSLRMDDVEQLLLLARKSPDGASEFAPIAADIARGRIAAFLHDERKLEVDDEDLKAFGAYARAARDPNQPALLAWYYFKLKRYSFALDWFKFALEHGGDATVAHGLAQSLLTLGMKREAEEVAYAWREPLIGNSILFIDILETELTRTTPPYIEPLRLARYGEVTMQTGSGQGAQALAWYAYNSCQYDVALQWFERAMAWFPKAPTAYGYALTLRRLKKRKEMLEIVNRYDGLFPQAVELLFPDGYAHPPSACDPQSAQAARLPNGPPYQATEAAQQLYPAQQAPVAGQPWRGGPAFPAGQFYAAGFVQDPRRQYSWGRVIGPGQGAGQGAAPYGGASGAQPASGVDQMPKIDKAEFPIKVDPENPLRFAPSSQAPLFNGRIGAAAPAVAGGYGREPARGLFPLVARRVPGVGPMPYERYGFALLPGYNGVTVASWPSASEQVSPAGTLWSPERQNDFSPDAGAAARQETRAPASPPPELDLPARTASQRNG